VDRVVDHNGDGSADNDSLNIYSARIQNDLNLCGETDNDLLYITNYSVVRETCIIVMSDGADG
jgi:hypothetical protein